MKKIIGITLVVCALAISLASCVHTHDWESATCTTPKTCSSCGKTVGTSLGHSYSDATCTTPKTCSSCGKTVGTSLGHSYSDATCTTPKTCSSCGKTVGTSLGHKYETGVCAICDELDPSAKTEQLAICEEIIEDLETLEKYCYAQTLVYQNAWYFSIYKAEDYYSYDAILTDFSKIIAIDYTYVNDAIVDYLEDIGLEAKQINAIAALRTNSGAIGVAQRAMELKFGMVDLCNELVAKISDNFGKINSNVVGSDYAEAIAEYCNIVLNYYVFAKSPSGSYNSFKSSASTYETYCADALNAIGIVKP